MFLLRSCVVLKLGKDKNKKKILLKDFQNLVVQTEPDKVRWDEYDRATVTQPLCPRRT